MRILVAMGVVAALAFNAEAVETAVGEVARVASPDGRVVVNVMVDAEGRPGYSVALGDVPVIAPSPLGLTAREVDLRDGFAMSEGAVSEFDETWFPVWGEYSQVRNHYNELPVEFSREDGARFTVRFRVYDDGVGFRYELPVLLEGNFLSITDESTSFRLADDYTLFAIPGDYDTDEYLYTTTPFSEIETTLARPHHNESTLIDDLSVQTPLMLKHPQRRIYVNIHEAALKGYPAMSLEVSPANYGLKCHLTPGADGMRAYVQTPFATPWRTIILSDDARDILASQLVYNLNEPCAIDDTSWIVPRKFVGVWWEMFLGGKSWAYSDDLSAQPGVTDYASLQPSGRHAANNANVRKYIDFAAETGIPAVLVEGWNQGWESWTERRKNRHFLFDAPYPDFDVDSLTAYAASRGVKLIMHHETSANAADYERQLDAALDFMNRYGYDAVKTGYVGAIIPRGEHHSSQWMNDHYIEVARRAAQHRVMVDSHEAVRPTGLARTYPNWVAQESARGGEYEAMGGNPPEHTVILPFTRLKGGPMDYTPGLFETDLSTHGYGNTCKGGTTLARQLALYLTMPSPLQMACDLPEVYRRYADAFRFIQDVPVDWSESVYLEAEPGEYITVARRDKHSDDWYLGAITDEKARQTVVALDFLPAGTSFEATLYEDAPDADYRTNPQAYRITTLTVDRTTRLPLRLAPGGGTALRLHPLP